MFGLGVLADQHWFVSRSASTTYLRWLCHSLSPDKEDYFVHLFAMALLPTTVWVLSLSIPHGMHLVVPTHPCFFWAVCHPNRTFPQKSLSRNPRIGFPLSPSPDHTLLPLTHDPPPPVLVGYRLMKYGHCACLTFACVQKLPATHALAVVWRLVCISCRLSLTYNGVSYLLIVDAHFCESISKSPWGRKPNKNQGSEAHQEN